MSPTIGISEGASAIYTAGYQGRDRPGFLRQLGALGAALWDIRFKPCSPNPGWQQGALRRDYPRYRHLGAWGNRNYKAGPIEFADYEAGLAALREQLAAEPGTPVVLLCACKDAASCHRTALAERLRGEGYAVEELPAPAREATLQHTLFDLPEPAGVTRAGGVP
jgi:hypothetical protein